MGFFQRFIDWLIGLLGGGASTATQSPVTQPETSPTTEPNIPINEPVTDPYRPVITGNTEPKILRVTEVNPELTGGIVGPEKDIITIPRKAKLYAAIRCDVVCSWNIKVLAGGTILSNGVGGSVGIADVGKDRTVIIGWPETNGYNTGTRDAALLLYNQNGKLVDRYDFTLKVE